VRKERIQKLPNSGNLTSRSRFEQGTSKIQIKTLAFYVNVFGATSLLDELSECTWLSMFEMPQVSVILIFYSRSHIYTYLCHLEVQGVVGLCPWTQVPQLHRFSVGRRSGLGRAQRSDPVFVLHDVAAFPTLSHVKRRYIESRAAASLLPTTTPTDSWEPNEHHGPCDNISPANMSQATIDSKSSNSRVSTTCHPTTEAYESFRRANN
jgi:hypothetical protein